MKRLGLVLFVSLGLQISMASAPFLHLHAAGVRDTGHHDGAVVHRHFAAHAAGDAHHDVDPPPADSLSAGEEAVTGSAVETSTLSLPAGAIGAGPHSRAVLLAAPTRTPEALTPPAPQVPPDEDVGRLSSAPDLDSPSLRGPPR